MSANPILYEIDTRAWLADLARHYVLPKPLTLDRVPTAELDRFAEYGFEWIWLMGVWRTGAIGRAISLANQEWLREFQRTLNDFQPEDVGGSPFAIQAYEVAPRFGGDDALAVFRSRLRERGLKLMLDFVPNHTARDHPWVHSRPEFYIHGTEADLLHEPRNFARVETYRGPVVLAFGRDPYYLGWSDTFQLNYQHSALRAEMIDLLARIVKKCDGLRCDMAMLVLPDVFKSTWGDRAKPVDGTPADDGPFWPSAFEKIRAISPSAYFLAEAYWDQEWTLQQQGFDATYDKRLYDRLRSHSAVAVRGHLQADSDFQRRSARFMENHDEPRAASVFPSKIHKAAAVLSYFVPGVRFFHQGQLEGRRIRPNVHLTRRPEEPVDSNLENFYARLLQTLRQPELHSGQWRLLECRRAWLENPTVEQFLAFAWDNPESGQWVIAANYGCSQGQCFLVLPSDFPKSQTVRFRDFLGLAIYERDKADLLARGLYLDIPPWGYHVFKLENV